MGDFHCDETELNWSQIGGAQQICKAAPNLEELTLRSGSLSTGALEFKKLTSFSVISGGLDLDSLKSIAAAKWPKLQRLSLQLGGAMPKDKALKALQPILDGKGLKKLRHLGLGNFNATDELCAILPGARILKQLETLDLSLGTMGDEGVEKFVEHGSKLSHLEINVSENYITNAGLKALKKICKKVESSSGNRRRGGRNAQREGVPEDRYIAALE